MKRLLKKANNEINDYFKQLGFYEDMTGGNCEAFTYDLSNGDKLMVTAADGISLPSSEDEVVLISLLDDEGEEKGDKTYSSLKELKNDIKNIMNTPGVLAN